MFLFHLPFFFVTFLSKEGVRMQWEVRRKRRRSRMGVAWEPAAHLGLDSPCSGGKRLGVCGDKTAGRNNRTSKLLTSISSPADEKRLHLQQHPHCHPFSCSEKTQESDTNSWEIVDYYDSFQYIACTIVHKISYTEQISQLFFRTSTASRLSLYYR